MKKRLQESGKTHQWWDIFVIVYFCGKWAPSLLLFDIAVMGTHMALFFCYIGLFYWSRKAMTSLFRWQLPTALAALTSRSSAVALPVGLRQLKKAGTSEEINDQVLPAGTTLNMDGTSAHVFLCLALIFQSAGYTITYSVFLLMTFVLVKLSMATAAAPGASLVLIGNAIVEITKESGMVLSPELLAAATILFLAADPISDALRTMCNTPSSACSIRSLGPPTPCSSRHWKAWKWLTTRRLASSPSPTGAVCRRP